MIGHLKALDKLKENPGVVTYNLGTGKGYSVLEMVDAFEKATGKPIPIKLSGEGQEISPYAMLILQRQLKSLIGGLQGT